jgi:hypothetical protein
MVNNLEIGKSYVIDVDAGVTSDPMYKGNFVDYGVTKRFVYTIDYISADYVIGPPDNCHSWMCCLILNCNKITELKLKE